MESYIPILIFLCVAAGFPVVTLALAFLVRPGSYNSVKMAPYECGIEVEGDARSRYSIRYYVIAVLFVVFDVEVIFFFPWAVQFNVLGLFGFIEMTIFVGILLLGYAYAWKKGALEWV
jgi:NADH-quinone oxidoreductase subunit A